MQDVKSADGGGDRPAAAPRPPARRVRRTDDAAAARPPGSPGSRRSAPRSDATDPRRRSSLPPPGDVRAMRGRGQVTDRVVAGRGCGRLPRPPGPVAGRALRTHRPAGRRRARRAARPVPRHDGAGRRRRPGTRSRASRPSRRDAGVLSRPGRSRPTGRTTARSRVRVDAGAGRRRRSHGRGARWSAPSTSRCCCAARGPAGTTSARSSRRRSASSTTSSASRRSGRTPSSTTRSASTATSSGRPVHDFIEGRRRPRPGARDRPAADRRALVHAARPRPRSRARPCSPTAGSSRRRATSTAGRRSSATSSPISPSDTAATRSRGWAFEVWNEPNLGSVLVGAESDVPAAVRRHRARRSRPSTRAFRVGGPATAAAGWIDDLLEHCRASDVPLDFIATHTYGMPPLDLRPITARFGRPDLPLWWTEWGVSSRHGALAQRRRLGAHRSSPAACGRRPAGSTRCRTGSPRTTSSSSARRRALFHGGFGMLTIGNLRKPRFWALAMLERLGDGRGRRRDRAATARDRSSRHGRRATTTAASRSRSGTARSTQSKAIGDRCLDRSVSARGHRARRRRRLRAAPPPGRRDPLEHPRDAGRRSAGPTGPMPTAGRALREADDLELLEPCREIAAARTAASSSRSTCRCPRSRSSSSIPIERSTGACRRTGEPRRADRGRAARTVGPGDPAARQRVDLRDPHGDVMINQVLGSPAEGGIGNVYLRAAIARRHRVRSR